MKLSAVTTAVVTALALAGCGSAADSGSAAGSVSGGRSTATSPAAGDPDSASGQTTASTPACGQQSTPHPELIRQLPAGFATVAGWQVTAVVNQGRTRVVSGVLAGEAADVVSVRDAAVSRLTAAGYAHTGSDEEPGHEAEAEFSQPYEVSVKVRPLCRGYLVLSYTVRR